MKALIHSVNRFIPLLFFIFVLGIIGPLTARAADLQGTAVQTSPGVFDASGNEAVSSASLASPGSCFQSSGTFIDRFWNKTGTFVDEASLGSPSGTGAWNWQDTFNAIDQNAVWSPTVAADYYLAVRTRTIVSSGCPNNLDAAYNIVWMQFHWNGSAWSVDGGTPPDDTTRIDAVHPADGEQVATSTLPYNFEVEGFINSDDYRDGARIMVKVDRNTDQQAQGALLAWDSAFGNKTYLSVDAADAFDVATSSDNLNLDNPLRTGRYSARWELQSPKFSIFGFNLLYSTLVASSTHFTIATTTAIDKIQLDGEDYVQQIVNDASGGDPLASCHFYLFDTVLDLTLGSQALNCFGGILYWMFSIPSGVLEDTATRLREGFLHRAPIGYFTRIVDAISGGVEEGLPTVHADIPIPHTDHNTSGEISIEFDIDSMIGDSATLMDSFETPDHKTARDILEPIIQIIVGLLVLMFIYNDVHSSMRRI